jgi:glycosyltransferase involved in cell wall biosynthesis
MEAMAAGCRIVTSDLGALPETTAGFARLVAMHGSREDYLRRFIEETVRVLQEMTDAPHATEDLLHRQVSYTNTTYDWKLRAKEWAQWVARFAA